MIDPNDLFYAGFRVDEIVSLAPNENDKAFPTRVALRNGEEWNVSSGYNETVIEVTRRLARLETARLELASARGAGDPNAVSSHDLAIISNMKPGRTPTRKQFDALQRIITALGGRR